MAVKDQIGGWIDNAHVFRMNKACTAMKIMLNKLWLPYTNAFGMKSNCPITPVTFLFIILNLFYVILFYLKFYITFRERMSLKD